jgi:hypothetical protein
MELIFLEKYTMLILWKRTVILKGRVGVNNCFLPRKVSANFVA